MRAEHNIGLDCWALGILAIVGLDTVPPKIVLRLPIRRRLGGE